MSKWYTYLTYHSTMATSHDCDALALLNLMKNKMAIAAAIVMVKFARREGMSAAQYTMNFQEKYVFENHDKIDPLLEQHFLRHCQSEVFEKLRQAISKPMTQPRLDSDDCILFGGGSMDCFEDCCDKDRRKDCIFKTNQKSTCNKVFSSEEFATNNIQFLESMMRISEECERKNPISMSLLQSLLYEEAENLNHFQDNSSCNQSFSEDSGIFCSEEFSKNSSKLNFIPNGVVKFALQSSSTKQLMVCSVRSTTKYVMNELKKTPSLVFYNWDGSLVEYACEILNNYTFKSDDCKEEVLNFIIDLLEDVWKDEGSAQQRQWEMKIHVVNSFLSNYECCFAILDYIADKLDYLMKWLTKEQKVVPKFIEKLSFFINFYSCTCEKIQNFKSKSTLKSMSEFCIEGCDLTSLWQEKWCLENSDSFEDRISEVDHVAVLERWVVYTQQSFPFLSMLTSTALKNAKKLVKHYKL